MECNKRSFENITRLVLCIVLFFCIAQSAIFAQNSDGQDWQYIEWHQEDLANVFRYQIQIEQRTSPRGEWKSVRLLYTNDNTPRVRINPQLAPGEYRYRITSYNLLDMPSSISDWAEFVIYRAFQPEISTLTVEGGGNVIFIDQENNGTIHIDGKNLFSLKGKTTDEDKTSYSLVNARGTSIEATDFSDHAKNNTGITLLFDTKKFRAGTFYLIAQDASGLKTKKTEQNKVTFAYKKSLDILFSCGFSPQLVLFDDTFSTHFGTSFFPLGLQQKATVLPFKRSWGSFGFAVQNFYTYTAFNSASYSLLGSLWNTNLSFAVYKPLFDQKLGALFKIGAGIFTFANYRFLFNTGKVSQPLFSTTASLTLGVSALYFFTKEFFLEAETNFVFAQIIGDITFGSLVPTVSVGLRL